MAISGDPDIISDFVVPIGYLAYSLNPHHTRPCATELFFLNYGILEVGFIDTTNKLFTQIYSRYWHCVSSTVLLTVVDDERILAKCFNTDVDTIQKLKAGFALKA
ncbi:hypothetical protein V6Z11_A01G082700 [Gossypium hirsutum]